MYLTNSAAPVSVAVVGTGDGTEIRAVTPGGSPDILVTVVTPARAIAIRLANIYVTIFVGLLAAGMTTNILPYDDFSALFTRCMELSIPGTVVGLLKDVVTLFGRLETKYPLITGSV